MSNRILHFLSLFFINFVISNSIIANNSSMRFIENKGQWDAQIYFQTKLNFGEIFYEKDNFSFLLYNSKHNHQDGEINHEHEEEFNGHFFKLNFINAQTEKIESLNDASINYYNYFIGINPNKWASYVREYNAIKYINIYPGINMLIQGYENDIKYEYYLEANADASLIQTEYQGVEDLQLKDGHLFYKTNVASIQELKPYAYQIIDGVETEVVCNFKLNKRTNTVSFEFPNGYDNSLELVIDPQLIFSRLSGSSSWNFGFTATYDDIGRAYGGGIVFNSGGNYPVNVGAFDETYNGGEVDIAISCYHQTTGAQIYGTYIGGNNTDLPNSMIVNHAGELVVLGTTGSSDFPLSTSNAAFDSTFSGGDSVNFSSNGVVLSNGSDIVIFKLSNDGSNLNASTFLGGTGNDGLNDDTTFQGVFDNTDLHFNYGDAFRGEVIVDTSDNIYITSSTNSIDFPTVNSTSFLQGPQDAIVVKLKSSLDTVIFSRYLGGSDDDAAYSMKIDDFNNLFVVGGTKSIDFPAQLNGVPQTYKGGESDGYITQLNNQTGAQLNTIFVGTDSYDQVFLIDLDLNNNVYVVGQTLGVYPRFNAAYGNDSTKHFIHKFSNDLSSTFYSTTFGSDTSFVQISPTALLVDICERVFVSGWGGYTNFFRNSTNTTFDLTSLPLSIDAEQTTYNGFGDFYFFVLDKNAASLEYATFFGGSAQEHVDGGTSRFDENGVIYQAVCAACSGGTFVTSPGYSNTANTQCNLGVIKFDLELPTTKVDVDAYPRAIGCKPLTVNFSGNYDNVSSFLWNFGDGNFSTDPNPIHTYLDTGAYQVTLIGVDSNSCNLADTAFLSVTVDDDSLIANFENDLIVNCQNLSVSAKAPNYTTTAYHWDMGDGTILNTDSIYYIYSTPGYYQIKLVLSDSTSCELADSSSVEVFLAPQLNNQFTISDTLACIPMSVDFEVFNTNYDSIYWDFGNGNFDHVNQSVNQIYQSAGSYNVSLIIIDSNTCNLTDTAIATIVAIDDSTHINYTLDSIFFDCDSMQLNTVSNNNNATSYFWDFGNGHSANTQNASSVYNAGNYIGTHILTDSNNVCYPSDTVIFNIDLLPKFELNVQVSDTFSCIPLEVDFFNNYEDFDSIYWDFGNGTTNTVDTNVSIIYNNVGTFNVQVIAFNNATCNLSDTNTFTINTIDDSTHIDYVLDSIFFDCDSMQLNAVSNYNNATSYFWDFDNGQTANTQNAASIYTAGNYFGTHILTDNTNICYPSDTAYFEIHLLPKLEISLLVDTFGCIPFDANFQAISSSNSASYFWDFGDGNNSTLQNPIHTYNNVGSYNIHLTATDTNTCNITNSDLTTINLVTGEVVVDIDITSSNFACDSLQVNLQAFYNGGVHEWDMGNGDIFYGTNHTYSYTQYGNYQISYTLTDSTQECLPQDTAIRFIDFHEVQANFEATDTFGCIPLDVQFNNLSSGNNTYWWNNEINSVGISEQLPNVTYNTVGDFPFTLVAIDSAACNISDTAIINIRTKDDFVSAAFDFEILSNCDSLLSINLDNQSNNAVNYYWDFGNNNSNQAEPGNYQYTELGNYTIQLIVENQDMCHPLDTVSYNFDLLPNSTALFEVVSACETDFITLNNLSNPNADFIWYFGDGNNSTDFNPNYAYSSDGFYDIQLITIDSNSCNIFDTTTQNIEVYNYPIARFTTDSNYYIYPDEVNFANLSNGYENFLWEFGDGTFDEIELDPNHFYESINIFTPCLIVSNEHCTDTICKEIQIDFIPLIGVPNAFSPNGDGVNDFAFVEGLGITALNFKIYNRWGEIVFETTDQTIGWDGIYKGKSQEMEVYTYIVNANLLDGSKQILKGNITLLR